MKILLLTPDIPFPSESGAAIRNYGIVRGLHAAGHCITLLTFVEDSVDASSNPLYQLCSAIHTVKLPKRSKATRLTKLVTSSKADLEFRLASPDFERTLHEILQSDVFDIVQFSGIELGGYLDLIQSEKRGSKVVYDALNAEAELQRVIAGVDGGSFKRLPTALYSSTQARRLSRFENQICSRVDAVIAVSDEDRDMLRNYAGAPITVMSNGINIEEYRPPALNTRAERQIVFSGKMDYRPNVDAVEWFCGAILPRIWDRSPAVRFVVVGRNPHPRIQALASDNRILMTGWVDSVLPYLHAASVFVVPLRMGSGTRLKILQAMAAGCAVVSTSMGAAGLKSDVRSALAIADGADQFVDAIVALLHDEVRRLELGARALQKVSAHYDWASLIPTLLHVYEDLRVG